MQQRNIVLHCQEGSSDKIYIACVRESRLVSGAMAYQAVGKWGRRGRNMTEQVKETYSEYRQAWAVAQSMAMTKEKKGYVDIESPGYDGPLTMSSPEVAKFREKGMSGGPLPMDSVSPEPKKQKKSKKDKIPALKPDEVMVAECKDNTGVEEDFDVGVDYIVDAVKGDMLDVIALNGEKKECYRERFGVLRAE